MGGAIVNTNPGSKEHRVDPRTDTALSSFNNMVKGMEAAEVEDVQAYQAWMEKHRPVDGVETQFLQHQRDLVAVSRKRAAAAAAEARLASGGTVRQSAAIWLPLVVVSPLMAFAIVPGLAGRLVVLGMIGAAMVHLLTTTQETRELMTGREWTGCFSV